MTDSNSLTFSMSGWLIGLALIFEGLKVTNTGKTVVSIVEDNFYINNQITYANSSNRNVPGLLFNARLIQGIFDDFNESTVSLWAYPDTGVWNASRNTDEFIGNMSLWRSKGLLAFTIGLQGGCPFGYCFTGHGNYHQPWIVSAFDAEGNLYTSWTDRLIRVLDAADELGMIPIVNFFYVKQIAKMQSTCEVAIANIVEFLMSFGDKYQHILVDVANEVNIDGFAQWDDCFLPSQVSHTIALVQNLSNHKLLVTSSCGGGHIPPDDTIQVSDFLLLHGNGQSQGSIRTMIEAIKTNPVWLANKKPIVFNEDDDFDFDQPVNHLSIAVDNHVSWGYFDFCGSSEFHDYKTSFQCVPVNWGISTPHQQDFFNAIEAYAFSDNTSEPVPAPTRQPTDSTPAPLPGWDTCGARDCAFWSDFVSNSSRVSEPGHEPSVVATIEGCTHVSTSSNEAADAQLRSFKQRVGSTKSFCRFCLYSPFVDDRCASPRAYCTVRPACASWGLLLTSPVTYSNYYPPNTITDIKAGEYVVVLGSYPTLGAGVVHPFDEQLASEGITILNLGRNYNFAINEYIEDWNLIKHIVTNAAAVIINELPGHYSENSFCTYDNGCTFSQRKTLWRRETNATIRRQMLQESLAKALEEYQALLDLIDESDCRLQFVPPPKKYLVWMSICDPAVGCESSSDYPDWYTTPRRIQALFDLPGWDDVFDANFADDTSADLLSIDKCDVSVDDLNQINDITGFAIENLTDLSQVSEFANCGRRSEDGNVCGSLFRSQSSALHGCTESCSFWRQNIYPRAHVHDRVFQLLLPVLRQDPELTDEPSVQPTIQPTIQPTQFSMSLNVSCSWQNGTSLVHDHDMESFVCDNSDPTTNNWCFYLDIESCGCTASETIELTVHPELIDGNVDFFTLVSVPNYVSNEAQFFTIANDYDGWLRIRESVGGVLTAPHCFEDSLLFTDDFYHLISGGVNRWRLAGRTINNWGVVSGNRIGSVDNFTIVIVNNEINDFLHVTFSHPDDSVPDVMCVYNSSLNTFNSERNYLIAMGIDSGVASLSKIQATLTCD